MSSSFYSSLNQLIGDAARAILIGKPVLPERQWGRPITPLLKLCFLGICGVQLGLFVVSSLGGVGLWTFVQLNGGNNPLTGSNSLVPSLILEGWFVVGAVLGFIILQMSRLLAIPPGVKWGWMSIRLGFLMCVIFVPMQLATLLNDETQSLAIGLVLLLVSYFFLKHGWLTMDEVIHISSEKGATRPKFFVKGEGLIFLSYRRNDSQIWTDRIAHDLKRDFGEKIVFQDTTNIPPGEDFPERLKTRLLFCHVLLVIIGPDWVTAKNEHGDRRLDQEKDWVRFEINLGLQRDILILPLLIDNATMPSKEKLPGNISKLADKSGLDIRASTDFENDMERLRQTLLEVLSS